jgi:exopolysaccharide biosynthesis protein
LAYPAEGWSPATIADSDRHAFYNAWLVRRNPRTAAGIREDGSLVLVVVDGRNPEHSIGASIPEMAGLMRHLGAIDAINLDGGGSSAMVVNGELVGIPSDMTDERAVSDAIVFTPADR